MIYSFSTTDYRDSDASEQEKGKEQVLVEFSVHELGAAYENSPTLFKVNISLDDIEDTLIYLLKIEAIKIEGGFINSPLNAWRRITKSVIPKMIMKS